MSAPLYFLPWLRRGLGLELGERDTGQALPRSAPVTAWVQLDGRRPRRRWRCARPITSTGIDAAQIIRRYPEHAHRRRRVRLLPADRAVRPPTCRGC